ncbi:hypothetical protein [Pacificoceanicola onchidii]|uniref:hypothetical protein n=1 Tax=Pacificoceanicola onchidii TaxID=2562685 RepID=UPI0010A30806|nr:hypothetical protein [Pacificoceanicola onchidii]
MKQLFRNPIHKDAASLDPGLNILFLAAFPLVLWLFRDTSGAVLVAVVEVALFAFALRLISAGHRIQREYEEAEVAYRPRLPRKVVGSLLIGVMVAVLAGMHFSNAIPPLLLGALAFGLGLSAFGIDPMQDKGLDNPEVLARLEAADYVELVNDTLIELSERVAVLGDAEMTLKTDATRNMASRVVKALSGSREDLRRLRKPVDKFVEILSTEIGRLEVDLGGETAAFARRRYLAKLKVLADSFEERARRSGVKAGRDAFDMEADMLIGRMPQENAA